MPFVLSGKKKDCSGLSCATDSSFRRALREEIKRSDARLEITSFLITIGLVLLCYALFMFFLPNKSPVLVRDISWLVAVMIAFYGALALAIRLKGYFEAAKWLSAFFGMSFVTACIYIDTEAYGVHALSSVPPYFYAFMVSLTAYRMQPSLTLFATAVAIVEFLGLYFVAFWPLLPDPLPKELAGIGPAVTIMKMIVLCGVGVACAAATRQMRRLVRSRVKEETRGAELERLFGRYVSPEIAREIARGQVLAPKVTDAVVMFGDLRGFTAFSEGKPPELVAGVLNEYFSVACRVIEEEGGVVNKFLGDGFMAFFGVPVPQADAMERSARAGLRLIRELNPVLGKYNLKVGYAIHAGPVTAGEIGSEGRCEYTIIGSTVNTASRIEGLNRPLGTQQLVSSEVARQLWERFGFQSRGKQEIRGLREPLEVFELTDIAAN